MADEHTLRDSLGCSRSIQSWIGFRPNCWNSDGRYTITMAPHWAGTPYKSPFASTSPDESRVSACFQHGAISSQNLCKVQCTGHIIQCSCHECTLHYKLPRRIAVYPCFSRIMAEVAPMALWPVVWPQGTLCNGGLHPLVSQHDQVRCCSIGF